MAGENQRKMPRDAAQICMWFKGMGQATVFLTTRDEADKAMSQYGDNAGFIEFMSYPDSSGTRSQSKFAVADMRGLTIEYPALQLTSIN